MIEHRGHLLCVREVERWRRMHADAVSGRERERQRAEEAEKRAVDLEAVVCFLIDGWEQEAS